MLEFRALCTAGQTRATAVRCPGGHSAEEPVVAAAVVLVRRGLFVRHTGGRAVLADVTTGYLQRPGETQRISHPRGGDVCTSLTVPPELADRFAHAGPVRVPAAADLIHRRLLAAPPGSGPTWWGNCWPRSSRRPGWPGRRTRWSRACASCCTPTRLST